MKSHAILLFVNDFWERALDAGSEAALVTVVRTSGSAPRRPPAKMLVWEDGRIAGTVGGGRIEKEVIPLAQGVSRGAPALRVRKHLVRDLGMCCGGEMELWIEPLDKPRVLAIGEVLRRSKARRATALVTALNLIGGKDLRDVDECLIDHRCRLEGELFIEPVFPSARLVLLGAGHVSRAVAPLAAGVGFEVIVCDEDERFATSERFPSASALVSSFDVRDVADTAPGLGASDYALIATRDHDVDQAILEQLISKQLAYLGLVGSKGKLERFRRRLEERSLGKPEDWARLHSPVGVDIGAESPEEIAVAIVAELIKESKGTR